MLNTIQLDTEWMQTNASIWREECTLMLLLCILFDLVHDTFTVLALHS
jgi:hypothetical protein